MGQAAVEAVWPDLATQGNKATPKASTGWLDFKVITNLYDLRLQPLSVLR